MAHDHHHHHYSHGHAEHGHSHAPASFDRAFMIGIGLNIAYVLAEAIFGFSSHSLALLADASHNLGDVLGLFAAWAASVLGRRSPGGRYTYGLRGSSILAALANAVLLLVITGGIASEAIHRLFQPPPAQGLTIMIVAAIGIAINGATAIMFMSGRKHDINIKGAYLHMAADALVSLGVVVTGAIIMQTGWLWLDPAISLVISLVIVMGTWSLLRESLNFALNAVPPHIDPHVVQKYLASLPGVTQVHDLHIWGMSTTETALTAHLLRPGCAVDDAMLHHAAEELHSRFGIGHATIQVEDGSDADHPCTLAPEHVV